MTRTGRQRRGSWTRWLTGALCAAAIGACSLPAAARENISPEADRLLRSMCSLLGDLKAFSMDVEVDNEIITKQGQKLQFSSHGTVLVERPDRFRLTREGLFADAEFRFDGQTITVHGKRLGAYAQFDAPGTIDEAIRLLEMETGLDTPGADLLFADPYSVLSNGIVSGELIGTGMVHGMECHHLAFREDQVDWQLWVLAGETPLPMKYVITSKWQAGAPQYSLELRNWHLSPRVRPSQFTFAPSQGARRLESIPVNEMGALALGEE